jgi:hypothetical protein
MVCARSPTKVSELVRKIRDFAVPLLVRHFVQRRIHAGIDPLAGPESRLPNLVVRLSLAQQPSSRQESETRNERRKLRGFSSRFLPDWGLHDSWQWLGFGGVT